MFIEKVLIKLFCTFLLNRRSAVHTQHLNKQIVKKIKTSGRVAYDILQSSERQNARWTRLTAIQSTGHMTRTGCSKLLKTARISNETISDQF